MPRKITQEAFIEKCKAKHGDLYDLSFVEYTGAEDNITVVCKHHGKFEINARGFANKGYGCRKCSNEKKTQRSFKTLEEYITRFRAVHANAYEYSYKSDKVNTDSHISISCNTCGHVFTQKVPSHLNGQGCPQCAVAKRSMSVMVPKEEALTRITSKWGDKYEIDFTDYNGTSSLVKVTCKRHSEVFYKDCYNLERFEHTCPKCKEEMHKVVHKKLPQETVIREFKEVHGATYDYSEVAYKGSSVTVSIGCKLHGTFQATPTLHKMGQGCPKCGRYILDTETFIEKAKEVHGNVFDYSDSTYKGSHVKTPITCNGCNHTYEVVPYSHLAGTGCPKCSAKMTSKAEDEIVQYLRSLGVDNIQTNLRGLIGRKELDIYLPDYKLAIEYNGLYWHSSNKKEDDGVTSKQHLVKTEACEELDIQLLHIFESEWLDITKKEIWKSVIRSKLGKNEKIVARKCEVKEVTKQEARKFCEDNHLQGNAHSSLQLGLYFEDNLVMLATFSKARFTDEDYELLRMCSLRGYTVVGGASKLIKNFKRLQPSCTLVSYANRRWSNGKVYSITGFTLKHYSKPCYFYYLDRATVKRLHHRSKFQKHKLKALLDSFNTSLSEVDNMYTNGYRRIWDSGNIVFSL